MPAGKPRQATAGRYLREASELARAFPSAGFSLLFLRAVNRLWSLNGKRSAQSAPKKPNGI